MAKLLTHCSDGHPLVFVCEAYDEDAKVYVRLLICPTCWADMEDYEYMDQRKADVREPAPSKTERATDIERIEES